MKKTVSIILAIAMIAAIIPMSFGCSSEKTLNLLNWGDYLEPSLKDKFKEQTGITIKENFVTSNEEMLIKLEAEDCPYDLCIPSDYAVERLISENCLAEINFENIPNYKYIGEDFRNLDFDPENKYSVPYTWGVLGILYNSKMVDESDIGSWDLLWNDKYAGQVYMYDSIRDSMAAALRYCGYDINTDNPDELEKAADALIELNPNIKAWLTDDVKDNMTLEKGAIALVYSGDAVWCSEPEEGNTDLKFYIPEEGSNIYFDNIVIPVNSTKKDMAEQFINFLLDPENAVVNTEFIGYSSANSEVINLIGQAWVDNPAYNIPIAEAKKNCVIFRDLGSKIELYNKQWDRVTK